MVCDQYDVEAVESVRSLTESPDTNLLFLWPIKHSGSCRTRGSGAAGRRRIVEADLSG